MGFLERIEGPLLRATIAAAFSGLMECAPTQTVQTQTADNSSPVGDAERCGFNRPRPSWIANPGDGFLIAESECLHLTLCDHANNWLYMKALSLALLEDKYPSAISGRETHYQQDTSPQVQSLGITEWHVGPCTQPNGKQGAKIYTRRF